MRTITATGLTITALAVSLSAAPAAAADPVGVQATRCQQEWDAVQAPGHRDGKVRIWQDAFCTNALGHDENDDRDWGDGTGDIKKATNKVSSVMNNGTLGGYDVVAFYDYTAYDWRYGYTCLKPGEYYADDLSNNKFSERTVGEHAGKAFSANDAISSHKWVTEADCTTFVD
ncbi:hypothetical protein [Nonomuraea sp. NPDC050643]|uniref:hypothetical protein n=1 Tax=Nonomuraea sp. NPDC050643 TaxID=3155660 RepID=UPI0033CBC47F